MQTTALTAALYLLGLGALMNAAVFVWLAWHTMHVYAKRQPTKARTRRPRRLRSNLLQLRAPAVFNAHRSDVYVPIRHPRRSS